MAKMREMGFASPSFFIEFMMRGVAPCTQGVVGSNPTQSTNLFALEGKKFDKKLFEFNHLYKSYLLNTIYPLYYAMSRLGELFDDPLMVYKVKRKLPLLFQMAELESARVGKMGM